MKKLISIFFLFISLCSFCQSKLEFRDADLVKTQNKIDSICSSNGIVGMDLSVIVKGNIEWRHSFGVGNANSLRPRISADGSTVVFHSRASNLVPSDENGQSDIFVYTAYNSELRRIIINGIEFTDYFEVDEKQKLLSIGEKFFGIWQDHNRQTLVDDVTILNNDR